MSESRQGLHWPTDSVDAESEHGVVSPIGHGTCDIDVSYLRIFVV